MRISDWSSDVCSSDLDQNEFLFSNTMLLMLFGAMVIVALRRRRHTGWHRRLMLSAMSILTGPGIGRLLPMPLLMPHSWRISIAVTMIFPVIGMIADKRRHGRVHPAWWGSVGAVIDRKRVVVGEEGGRKG